MLPTLIAVVDDDATICDLIAEALTDSGYPVVCYANGRTLFDELDQVRPTLLILDLRLEQRPSGWEILQELRSRPTTYDLAVILSTADVQFVQEHSDDVYALGATILHKPFELDTFLGTVARALRGEHRLGRDIDRP